MEPPERALLKQVFLGNASLLGVKREKDYPSAP